MGTTMWRQSYETFLLQHLLHRPPKAIGSVLIDSLDHQQDRPKLENRCTDPGGPSATVCDLTAEFSGGVLKREPNEECIDTPDNRTQCEDDRYQVGNIPIWTRGKHPPYSLECFLQCARRWRSKVFRITIHFGGDNDGVPT